MFKNFTKTEKSWLMYDWANSAYVAAVMTTILPIFFKSITKASGLSDNIADSYWGYATAIATLSISLIAPILGTLGDYQGMKLKLFRVFFLLGVLSTFALSFSANWKYILLVYIISIIGYSGANLFYDALIVDVTSIDRMDRVSTYGYALGYVGGSLLPVLALGFYFLFGADFKFNFEFIIRISFIVTALWWFGFSLPLFKNVQQVYYREKQPHLIKTSFRTLSTTFKNIRQYRHIFLFLLAYFFYIDGVNTIIHMATVYGSSMGVSNFTLVVALLASQFVTIPCTILAGSFARKFGSNYIILSGIIVYIAVCILGYRLKTDFDFWIITLLVGTSQGGLQALSRSYFGKIIPPNSSNEFFGFYDILGKFSAIIGPALYGVFSQITGKSQYGVLSILILFLIGGGLFLYITATEKSSQDL